MRPSPNPTPLSLAKTKKGQEQSPSPPRKRMVKLFQPLFILLEFGRLSNQRRECVPPQTLHLQASPRQNGSNNLHLHPQKEW
jgi:hypothetical protein